MLKLGYYDENQEKINIEESGSYNYSEEIEIDPDHPEERADWKYVPSFKILLLENNMITSIVLFLLFVYVAIISLAAVGIIAYSRSLTVAIKNIFNALIKCGICNRSLLITQYHNPHFFCTLLESI